MNSGPAAPGAPWQARPDGRVTVWAPAKLNLCLHVGPLGPDGYHPLDSLVAKVTLYDELILANLPDGRVELVCDNPAVGAPGDNLAFRAAKLLQERAAEARGARIELRKHIAVGAGLGSGSSDAAAALAGLNRLWGLGLSVAELSELALRLGSDVPLFLAGPASRMQGRGERLTPIACRPFWAVLVCPPFGCPTPAVYAACDQAGPRALQPAEPDILVRQAVEDWPARLRNDLYGPACRVCPDIARWADRLARAAERTVQMTGSGSALFVLSGQGPAAQAIARRLEPELARQAHVVTLNPW